MRSGAPIGPSRAGRPMSLLIPRNGMFPASALIRGERR